MILLKSLLHCERQVVSVSVTVSILGCDNQCRGYVRNRICRTRNLMEDEVSTCRYLYLEVVFLLSSIAYQLSTYCISCIELVAPSLVYCVKSIVN